MKYHRLDAHPSSPTSVHNGRQVEVLGRLTYHDGTEFMLNVRVLTTGTEHLVFPDEVVECHDWSTPYVDIFPANGPVAEWEAMLASMFINLGDGRVQALADWETFVDFTIRCWRKGILSTPLEEALVMGALRR